MTITPEQAAQIDRANAFEIGFAKAAHDAGLTEQQYQAVRAIGVQLLQKQAAGDDEQDVIRRKKPKGLRAEDITDTHGFGGGLVDYLTPGSPFASRRAGRASALADALGQDPGMLVEHPNTSNAIAALVGGGLGGLASIGIGSQLPPSSANGAMPLIGVAGGSLAALIAATYFRRKRAQELAEQFDAADKLEVRNPNINRLGGLFGGATHQSGRMEGLEKILGKRRKDDDSGLGLDIGRTAGATALSAAAMGANASDNAEVAGMLNTAGHGASLGIDAWQTIDAKDRERKLFSND